MWKLELWPVLYKGTLDAVLATWRQDAVLPKKETVFWPRGRQLQYLYARPGREQEKGEMQLWPTGDKMQSCAVGRLDILWF
jgi:hypothetical protein